MNLRDEIQRIKSELTLGRFTNEAAISQGIILPILNSLGWSIFDTHVITPQFSVENRRVDFAVCAPPDKPVIFIEVKAIGHIEGADKQLFEYAFHQGVPLLILTDGKEWNFYLPAEQGNYQDRIVYKLDLLERSIDDSIQRLERYLAFNRVVSGEALNSAREDYKSVIIKRQAEETLPKAWIKLLERQDDILIELLADETTDICGFKPDRDDCSKFLKQILQNFQIQPKPITRIIPQPTPETHNSMGFSLYGKFYPANSAIETMANLFRILAEKDKTFLERFASRKHGVKRRYIARTKNELYKNRPDLSEKASMEISNGWWIGTNYSKGNIDQIIRLAVDVAGLKIGSDLIFSLDRE